MLASWTNLQKNVLIQKPQEGRVRDEAQKFIQTSLNSKPSLIRINGGMSRVLMIIRIIDAKYSPKNKLENK
jgi:hypothetical protein